MTTATADHDQLRSKPRSSPVRRRRLAPWMGCVFAVAFFASFALGTSTDIHDSNSKTLTYFSQDATKWRGLVAWGLAVVAVLMLIGFLAELVRHLQRAGDSDSQPLAVMLAGGLLVAAIAIASAIRAAPAGDLLMDSEQRAGTSGKLTASFADFAQTTGSLYDWLAFFGIGLGAAALVISVSLAARSTKAVPRWLQWAGYAAAPVLAFVAFFNLIVLVLWVVAVNVVIARAPEPTLVSG